ncbi:MAG: hypothetical protein AAGC67_04375 [Myxococcota bacterium]
MSIVLDNTNGYSGVVDGVTVSRPGIGGPIFFDGATIAYATEPVCNGTAFSNEVFYGGANRVGAAFTQCIVENAVPFVMTVDGSGNTFDVVMTYFNRFAIEEYGTPPNANAPGAAMTFTPPSGPDVPIGSLPAVGLAAGAAWFGRRALRSRSRP